MSKKKILTVCCTGGCTSSIIANKVKEIADNNAIDVELHTCKILEVKGKVTGSKYDLIVSSTNVQDYGVPVVNGRSFLSGVNVEKTESEILELLNGED